MTNAFENIPEQQKGEQTDFIHFADAETRQKAHNLFLLAKERLKDISNWHQISGPGSSKFSLTDAQGNELYRMAQKDDYFYIDLPAPGSIAGSGLDWVMIESIEEHEDANAESEFITITVRPVVNPRKPDTAIANFYDHSATNTFIVERYLNHVSAAVHGRNEVPNTKDTNIFDTIRNTIIALTASVGLSGPQWKALVEGLLKE
ncbi:hypothetical protein SAMN05216464_10414 [Mucilaginibacter pineti]|uniref:Uncharacterized protein n=1 Tax=Mucilaginibacter pineti TaxID=1391627 RepID=A0A1G7AAR0_9SPHI|nr:hypothetical protein [Mucilaginibacter pineti]SDE11577.1 hypothetical protein SAMN05216464_10414 [Mucilaginibacter pineti]